MTVTYEIVTPTYLQVVQSICRMVGHPVPLSVSGSSDPAVLQMGMAVNNALTELMGMFEWQPLTVRATMPIVADEAQQQSKAFDLPVDFDRFIDQTQWSRNTMLPAAGPVSPQGWQYYTVRKMTPTMYLAWQMRGKQLWVLSPPYPNPVDFEFMYITKGQVIDADSHDIHKNLAVKDNDTFILHSGLILLSARVKYLEWKGFDSAAAARDFWNAYAARTGADKGGAVLNLGGASSGRLIGDQSVPVTGYGGGSL